MFAINRSDLFKDAQFFQTPEGLLIGTLVLLLFWVLLRVLEAVQKPSWAVVTRSVRRPLVFGFGVALYTGWLFGLLAKNVEILSDRNVAQLTTSIVLLVFGRAVNVAGLKFLHSKVFNRWLNREIEEQRERDMMISLLDRVYTILVFFITFGAIMIAFGISPTAVGAVLGGAGIGIGFGTQQISQNFLSGLMLFFNRPFAEGDWINVSTFEGTVERIGWYHTQIRTFDRRPLFIPNSLFATTPIENPGRMYNRRIKEEIGLRYEDIGQIADVVREVKTMLQQHPAIDQEQTILVNFNQWGDSSINVLIYAFTKTTVWAEWLDVQQDVFLRIAEIVRMAGADFAFPSTTVYPSSDFNPQHPLFFNKGPGS
ncbi:hypothetical protein KR100_05620 [Synechococcus sp. KORDI-100]|uniref:mechanosensitive ion channel family protein n=1 Tax=Synechococcus sp. KORDI-100 TaxID=1280380 RepID=UPI0004E03F9C|nr:mechanosensitive ion channel family protein [Synechococcus sp. KORDI-100]AII42844.1 hypothetical protein KR100_05620 [Synechococcus sp. KORDI-100]